MKNLIFCLLFSCSFIGGPFTSSASELNGGGVLELTIAVYKTGDILYSFDLPKAYQNKEISVVLTQGKGNVVWSEINNDGIVTLPNLSGVFYLSVSVDDLSFTKKISL